MPGRTAAFACVERIPHEPVLLSDQIGVLRLGVARDEGSRHVRPAPALLVAGPDVDVDRQSRRERAAARLVAAALPDRGDDHIGRAWSSVRGARLAQSEADVLGEERLAVHLEAAFGSAPGAREQLETLRPSPPRRPAVRRGCLRARPVTSSAAAARRQPRRRSGRRPPARRRSPSASGKSAGTIASLMPISRTTRASISSPASCIVSPLSTSSL